MRISFLSKPRNEEIEQLIERYYEALTTVEEEKELYRLLSHPSMKGKYEAERAILSYFKEDRNRRIQWPVQTILRRVAVVAVIIISSFYVMVLISPEAQASYAWVNGKKVTNITKVKSYAVATLNSLPSSATLVEDNIKEISANQVIENQLAIFAGN